MYVKGVAGIGAVRGGVSRAWGRHWLPQTRCLGGASHNAGRKEWCLGWVLVEGAFGHQRGALEGTVPHPNGLLRGVSLNAFREVRKGPSHRRVWAVSIRVHGGEGSGIVNAGGAEEGSGVASGFMQATRTAPCK